LARCVKTDDAVSREINRIAILSEIQREEHARYAIIDKSKEIQDDRAGSCSFERERRGNERED
jgi:hypothetical protein